MHKRFPFFSDVTLREIEVDDDWKRLTLRLALDEVPAVKALHGSAATIKRMMREAEIALGGIRWKAEHATNERAFCEEILTPLLRRMVLTAEE